VTRRCRRDEEKAMQTLDALEQFRAFAAARGVTIERLSAAEEAAIIAGLHWPPEVARDPTIAFYQRARIDHLAAVEALALVTAFYREVRAEDCDLEADGDMLLFQWGTYTRWVADDGLTNLRPQGEAFEYDITRQLVPVGQADVIAHLSLRFRYPPTAALRLVGEGNRWCLRPGELGAFLAFARDSPATGAVAGLIPEEIRVTLENAE
jgi:hypothetical protein